MKGAPPVALSPREWAKLLQWTRGRSVPVRRAERARIVLLAAEGRNNKEIAKILRMSPVTVRRWRARFALLGLAGISADAPRSGHKEGSGSPSVATILERTRSARPTNGVRWTTRTLAKELGASHTTIARAWRSSGVRPPPYRHWRLSPDPRVRDRRIDVAGLYVDPPRTLLALSIDFLGNAPGATAHSSRRGGSGGRERTEGDRRALGRVEQLAETVRVLDGLPPSAASWKLTSRELLLFLESVNERSTRASEIHLLTGASSIFQDARVLRWLDRHPRFHLVTSPADQPISSLVRAWLQPPRTSSEAAGGLASLPGLERSLGSFLPGATLLGRPFAWTRSGAVSHWRSPAVDTYSSSTRDSRDFSSRSQSPFD